MRIVQLKDLDVRNPSDDALLALMKADVVAWTTGNHRDFYFKHCVIGPIRQGGAGEYYRVKLNGLAENVVPTVPIVVVN